MDINQFKKYYDRQIIELKRNLSSTIKSILSQNINDIVNIDIVEKGTCISYENRQIDNGSYIDYVENINLKIGFEEILYMYDNCNDNLFDGFNKLVTHEFLHVLFGDFSKKKLTYCYNFLNGSLENDSNLENNKYYVNTNNDYVKNGYEKINNKIYNYAADFVINNELDIIKPFLRASDFDLEEGLTVFEYYSIIMNNEDVRNKIKLFVGDLNFVNEDILGNDYNSGTSNIPISNSKMEKITDEDLLEDLFTGKNRGLGPSSINFVIKRLKKKDSIFLTQTKEVINQIKNDMFNRQDENVDKSSSWFKLNNRRDYDDLILPGREIVNDIKSKNYEKRFMPIIFVDCSRSMMDIMKELFYFCFSLLNMIHCTIVFYNSSISKVINSANSLNFNTNMFIGGGTNLEDVIKEYKKDYNSKINNVYVFSDGEDNYSNIDVPYLTIFKFDKNGIKKIKEKIPE